MRPVAFNAWPRRESTLAADDYERCGGDSRSNRQSANHGQCDPVDRSDRNIGDSRLHLAAAISADDHRLYLCRALRPLIPSLLKILSRRGLEHRTQISHCLRFIMGKISASRVPSVDFLVYWRAVSVHCHDFATLDFAP